MGAGTALSRAGWRADSCRGVARWLRREGRSPGRDSPKRRLPVAVHRTQRGPPDDRLVLAAQRRASKRGEAGAATGRRGESRVLEGAVDEDRDHTHQERPEAARIGSKELRLSGAFRKYGHTESGHPGDAGQGRSEGACLWHVTERGRRPAPPGAARMSSYLRKVPLSTKATFTASHASPITAFKNFTLK